MKVMREERGISPWKWKDDRPKKKKKKKGTLVVVKWKVRCQVPGLEKKVIKIQKEKNKKVKSVNKQHKNLFTFMLLQKCIFYKQKNIQFSRFKNGK